MTEPGHYEIGIRDGGSAWHIGTANRRECEQGCADWLRLTAEEVERLRTTVLTAVVDQGRAAISNAYYDARNRGEPMEDAASRAAGAVVSVVEVALRAALTEPSHD